MAPTGPGFRFPHDLASATYVPQSGNVQIRLIAGDRSENVNVIGIDKTPALDNRTALQISALESRSRIPPRPTRHGPQARGIPRT